MLLAGELQLLVFVEEPAGLIVIVHRLCGAQQDERDWRGQWKARSAVWFARGAIAIAHLS